MLWNSVAAAGGGRNQLSSERFLMFLRTEITLISFTIVVLPPFICPVAKYPIPTPIPHLPTASCTYPTFNNACAEEMASPAKAIAAAARQQK